MNLGGGSWGQLQDKYFGFELVTCSFFITLYRYREGTSFFLLISSSLEGTSIMLLTKIQLANNMTNNFTE